MGLPGSKPPLLIQHQRFSKQGSVVKPVTVALIVFLVFLLPLGAAQSNGITLYDDANLDANENNITGLDTLNFSSTGQSRINNFFDQDRCADDEAIKTIYPNGSYICNSINETTAAEGLPETLEQNRTATLDIDTLRNALVSSNGGVRLGDGQDSVNPRGGLQITGRYDVATASSDGSFDVSGRDQRPLGLDWNNNGSKLYFVGDGGNSIYEYTASTAFDASTASFSTSLDVSGQDGTPTGIAWSGDGSKLFMVGRGNANVYEYTASTPFDLSTATYSNSLDISPQDSTPRGISVSGDGTELIVGGDGTETVYGYSLSTPNDVSTASVSGSHDVSSEEANARGVAWGAEGTRLFVVGDNSGNVYEYTVSTPYSVDTAEFDESFSVSSEDSEPSGLSWDSNGSQLYISGNSNNKIQQYRLASGDTDFAGGSLENSIGNLSVADNLSIEGDLNLTGDSLYNFFNQSGCSSGRVIDQIYPDGSYSCISVDSVSSVEGLPATLDENNTANQEIDLDQNNISNVRNLENFFDQSKCAEDEAIKTVYPNGSYECNSISTTTEAEGLPETLAVNSTANQTIKFSSGIELGEGSNAGGPADIAIGKNAESTDLFGDVGTIAIGKNAGGDANNGESVAIGPNAQFDGGESVALGYNADTTGNKGVAVGPDSTAAQTATAVGVGSTASAYDSLSLGHDSTASALGAMAMGPDADGDLTGAIASADGSVAIGSDAIAPNQYEATFGNLDGEELDVNVTGNLTVHGEDLDLRNGDIENFFDQTKCADDEAIKTVYPNGSYECNSISTTTETENLSETLAAGNVANQTIRFEDGIQIGDSGTSTSEGDAVAVGKDASASALGASAVGRYSVASGHGTAAFGSESEASGYDAAAFGTLSEASGDYSMALTPEGGFSTDNAQAEGSVAIGRQAVAPNPYEATFGNLDDDQLSVNVTGNLTVHGEIQDFFDQTKCADDEAIKTVYPNGSYECNTISTDQSIEGLSETLEENNTANQTIEFSDGIQIGDSATSTTGGEQIAVGNSASASALGASAFGYSSEASSDYASAFGSGSYATVFRASAFGYSSTASGAEASAVGAFSTASGAQASAVGASSEAFGAYASAFGHDSSVSGDYASAFGDSSEASSTEASAVGYLSEASGSSASAFGHNSQASADYSMALTPGGGLTTENAQEEGSVAIGREAVAPNSYEATFGNLDDDQMDVNVTGDLTVHGDIENFFDQTKCADDEAIKTVYPNGSYECNSISTTTETENLSETLAAGNVANQTIRFEDGIEIGNSGTSTSGGDQIAVGKDATASDLYASAFGSSSSASAGSASAVGRDSVASGDYASAVGGYSEASGDYSMALTPGGDFHTENARAEGSVAIGRHAIAPNQYEATFGNLDDDQLDVNVTGNLTVHGDIENFFDQTKCAEDEAIKTVYPNGSYECNSISTTTETENISETLAAGNVANQTIRFEDGIQIGDSGTSTSGSDQIAVGKGASASGNYASAVGPGSYATVSRASAFGFNSVASGNTASAFGPDSEASGGSASAFGRNSVASAGGASAVGFNSEASAQYSMALTPGGGYSMENAQAEGSVAIGREAVAPNQYEATFGNLDNDQLDVNVTGNLTVHGQDLDLRDGDIENFFDQTQCADDEAIKTVYPNGSYECNSISTTTEAEGLPETLAVNNSMNQSIGLASGQAVEIGTSLTTNLPGDVAIGRSAEASGAEGVVGGPAPATAVGHQATATGVGASAFGYQSEASGYSEASAFGEGSEASGDSASAFGEGSEASGVYASAFGEGSEASVNSASAFGRYSEASGSEASAFGVDSEASAEGAVGIGYQANAANSYEATFGNLDDDQLDVNVTGDLTVHGDQEVMGAKNFVHELNGSHEAVYTSQESPDARAVYEGNASVEAGETKVDLPSHFEQVVSDSRPELRVQVTPIGRDAMPVRVFNKSQNGFVVEQAVGDPESFSIDYRITGIRDGYEDKQAVREN